jgi:hypothetical protein
VNRQPAGLTLARAYELWDQRASTISGYAFPTMMMKLGLELEPEAGALEDEMRKIAERLGVTSSALRVRIVDFRGSGHDCRTAVSMAITSFDGAAE